MVTEDYILDHWLSSPDRVEEAGKVKAQIVPSRTVPYGGLLCARLPPLHMFSESPLCSPPQGIFDHLVCRLAQLRVPKLLARDQPAVNSLPQRLTYKRPLHRSGLYQIKNRS